MSGEVGGQMPNGRSQARIGLSLEAGEALTHDLSVGFRKTFDPTHLHIARTATGKGINCILVAKRFESLTEYQGSLLFKIEPPTPAADPRLNGSTAVHQQGYGDVASTRPM